MRGSSKLMITELEIRAPIKYIKKWLWSKIDLMKITVIKPSPKILQMVFIVGCLRDFGG